MSVSAAKINSDKKNETLFKNMSVHRHAFETVHQTVYNKVYSTCIVRMNSFCEFSISEIFARS